MFGHLVSPGLNYEIHYEFFFKQALFAFDSNVVARDIYSIRRT